MKYKCELCGWVYDEAAGYPKRGIAPNTTFEQLPSDFSCPLCGAEKEAFFPVDQPASKLAADPQSREFWHAAKYPDAKTESDR